MASQEFSLKNIALAARTRNRGSRAVIILYTELFSLPQASSVAVTDHLATLGSYDQGTGGVSRIIVEFEL